MDATHFRFQKNPTGFWKSTAAKKIAEALTRRVERIKARLLKLVPARVQVRRRIIELRLTSENDMDNIQTVSGERTVILVYR